MWKVCKNCVWEWVGKAKSVWKYQIQIPQLHHMLPNTRHVEIGNKIQKNLQKLSKVCVDCVWSLWKCVKECVRVCETQDSSYPYRYGSNGTSGSPDGLNKPEKSALLQQRH